MSEQQGKPGLAVVTGAAGGMGSAAAVQLCAQGWSLLLCDLEEVRLEENAGHQALAPRANSRLVRLV
jgi:NAD(P)-dependent dehydrogenase (short-subunit alcohol dehydrogenase family)